MGVKEDYKRMKKRSIDDDLVLCVAAHALMPLRGHLA